MTERRGAASQPAWLLHRWHWSETSLILDLFTRGLGRVAVVAKGAQRPYSQFKSVLLPFQRLQVGLSRPAGEGAEMMVLRSAEWAGQAALISGRATFAGLYLNELLQRLLARQDPHPVLFDAYGRSIAALAMADGDDAGTAASLRAFELMLLRETGVLPALDVVTHTQAPVRPEGRYAIQPDAGLVAARGDEPALMGNEAAALQATLHAAARADADEPCWPALLAAAGAAAAALKPQLRRLLAYHLGPQPLRTREALHEVQRLLDARPAP